MPPSYCAARHEPGCHRSHWSRCRIFGRMGHASSCRCHSPREGYFHREAAAGSLRPTHPHASRAGPETPPAFLRHARLRRTSAITRYTIAAALEALGQKGWNKFAIGNFG